MCRIRGFIVLRLRRLKSYVVGSKIGMASSCGALLTCVTRASRGRPRPKDKDGNVVQKPSWQAQSIPTRHITDPAEVEVVVPKEIKRFRVAVRVGASGTRMKLTDASGEKLQKALDKAGPDSWHEFSYATQEAIIFVPEKVVPLLEFVKC